MQFHFTDIKTAKPDTEEGEDDEDETPDKATQFLDDVLAKASIQQLSDELIALEGIMCLNLSRAKYDVTVRGCTIPRGIDQPRLLSSVRPPP